METIIKDSAYNEGEGGLKMSRLIDRHMIDYFIPFLPLERKHVIMCFKDYLKRKFDGKSIDVSIASIEKLADSLHVKLYLKFIYFYKTLVFSKIESNLFIIWLQTS